MGGGIGMGNTCKPMAVSFQCMTKSTTIKKKRKKKKKRIVSLVDDMDMPHVENAEFPTETHFFFNH